MDKIKLEHVDKIYDNGVQVIKDLNLTIEEGSFTVLLGPSGCGKSTTLRMIAGLEEVSGGTLTINGKDMKNVPPGDRDIAMVFQNYAIYPTMTVRGNIEFGLKNAKVPKEEREKRIREIGETTGLTPYMDRKPSALSGGQRQRVALARAMVKNPQVFLMDEPLSNLDAKLRGQLRTELIELHQRLGATFVYVTHDQSEATSMGTHIILMDEGNIMQQGTPEDIYLNPDNVFTARFIGNPPMNIFETASMSNEWEDMPGVAYVGCRPHDVLFEKPEGEASCFQGTIMTREMLGSEIHYKLRTPYGVLHAKNYEAMKRYSGLVNVWIPKKDLCFFDKNKNRIRNAG
ncbi:MAG: ABC transporter ATP-binding protein [Lachnospiraceae bacterium]|nr:ABC transporter ATP-binding protein [Lachnospiraceae bacterium]